MGTPDTANAAAAVTPSPDKPQQTPLAPRSTEHREDLFGNPIIPKLYRGGDQGDLSNPASYRAYHL